VCSSVHYASIFLCFYIRDHIIYLVQETNVLGAGKYGLYEIFKKTYADIVGEEVAHQWRTALYLSASASAELFADVLLCPWEAIKVRMQTTIPPFAKGTLEGWSKIQSTEGIAG
jgi:solute carrier family 25 (mitochondrial phosphate transporter), member 3